MSKYVLLTEEGKRVVIDPNDDSYLFESPRNPPNTGTVYTRGTDLHVHKARSGKNYFYFYSWSMWQGEDSSLRLCSFDEAEKFLTEKAGNTGYDSMSESEMSDLEQYGFNLLEETA